MSQNVYSVSALVHYIKQTLDNDIRIQSILIKGKSAILQITAADTGILP
ncbi:MAG: hypothetical protein ACLRL6_04080 [Clostridium sp.]